MRPHPRQKWSAIKVAERNAYKLQSCFRPNERMPFSALALVLLRIVVSTKHNIPLITDKRFLIKEEVAFYPHRLFKFLSIVKKGDTCDSDEK